jgi:transketolase
MPENKQKNKLKATRDALGEALLEAGKDTPSLVVLSADLAESTRANQFAQKYPDRFIEVGVAEQNMASVAAGFALAGKIPVITSFGVFSPGRNWDQIRISVCYNNANVKIFSTHTGLSAGRDGATHQALEDIALTRVLPNMTVLSPCDYWEAKKAIKEALTLQGPVYVRLSRATTPTITTPQHSFEIGKTRILEEGEKVCVLSTGTSTPQALAAAKAINDKYPNSVRIVNCPTIKPLQKEEIMAATKGISDIITLEEHQVNGGFGSTICELLSQEPAKKVTLIGMQDSFGESGAYEELLKKYKIDKESVKQTLLEKIK